MSKRLTQSDLVEAFLGLLTAMGEDPNNYYLKHSNTDGGYKVVDLRTNSYPFGEKYFSLGLMYSHLMFALLIVEQMEKRS